MWNPFRSKLAAAVLAGVDNIHIKPGAKVRAGQAEEAGRAGWVWCACQPMLSWAAAGCIAAS